MTTTLTPLASRMHRVAALITEHQLPPASVNVYDDGTAVSVHVNGDSMAENGVRRWADAVGLLVEMRPHETADGTACDYIGATGSLDGVWWSIATLRPVALRMTA